MEGWEAITRLFNLGVTEGLCVGGVAGASTCGNDFEQKTVYWVAVDAFKKALSNEDTKARASKSINTYSKYFPTTETCFFNGVESGKAYMVSCWINKSTIVRTSD